MFFIESRNNIGTFGILTTRSTRFMGIYVPFMSACENYEVERQRHNKQIDYTQDSSCACVSALGREGEKESKKGGRIL